MKSYEKQRDQRKTTRPPAGGWQGAMVAVALAQYSPPTLQSGKLTWTTPQPTPPCPIYKSLASAPAAMELKVDTVRRRRRCRRPGERRRRRRRNSCSVVSRAVVCARAHTTATKRLSFRRFRNDSTNKATKERKKRN